MKKKEYVSIILDTNVESVGATHQNEYLSLKYWKAFISIKILNALAYGKAGTVGLNGEIEHASAFIHTLRFGNKFRDAVGGTSYLSFTNTRGPAGSKISIPMMHKTDSGLRPYYLTHEFTIHDAPFDDEIVIAIGGASSGRAHARTGDRYQDMKEMGLDPK